MTTPLTPAHAATYEMIFRHPVARNLEWRSVRSLLEALADSTEPRGDHVKFTRNGHTLLIDPPRRKDLSDVRSLMDVRRFLERSSEAASAGSGAAAADGVHLLVVIDHRAARVYRTEFHGTVPQRIVTFNGGGAGRHLHYVEDDASGQRRPEQRSFYDAVAKTLEGAQTIVVLGSGTGASSAMDQLLAELQEHHPRVAEHVVGTRVVDAQHMTDDQLLAQARAVHTKRAVAPSAQDRDAAD